MAFSTVGLTIYVLMWPVIVLCVMFVIARGFIREWYEARKRGKDMI